MKEASRRILLAGVLLGIGVSLWFIMHSDGSIDSSTVASDTELITTSENLASDEKLFVTFNEGENTFLPTIEHITSDEVVAEKSAEFTVAPEFAGIHSYINSEPFELSELRGKVVLVDFWTYTCINCVRTFPYLKAWNERYSEDGLVIVGVHTPEFEFEKIRENVIDAVNENGITYPVIQDNDYRTWRNYKNRWWPRKYLVDIDGFIRYDHIGEGGYDVTERKIQELLEERNERLELDMSIESGIAVIDDTLSASGSVQSPEMYFGHRFDRGHFGNPEGLVPDTVTKYTLPNSLEFNRPYFSGTWNVTADYSELVSEQGIIVLAYSAKQVNIVASAEPAAELQISVDGNPVDEDTIGFSDTTVIKEETIYGIIDADYSLHTLQIVVPKGFRIYAFTFG